MTITDVRVRLITSDGASRMKAIAAITIDGVFVVHDIKVLEGEAGLFIAMPSRKSGDGEFRDIAHPINSETRAMVSETVIAAYDKALAAAAVAED